MGHMVSGRRIVANSFRFDLPFKNAYVRTRMNDVWEQPAAEYFYLKSIEAFNGFYESEPKKVGPADFLRDFDAVIDSIANNGFDPRLGSVPINADNEPVSGAHRLVTSAFFQLDVLTSTSDLTIDYNHDFFVKRGMGSYEQFYGLLEWLDMRPDLRWIVVHQSVPESLGEKIREIIDGELQILFSFSRNLSDVGILNLKYLNYSQDESGRAPDWIGTVEDSFAGLQEHAALSQGEADTRFYLVHARSRSAAEDVKRRLRSLLPSGHHGFHSSDSATETRRIAETFAHDESFRIFNRHQFPIGSHVDDQLEALSAFVQERLIPARDFCVGGSAPMAVLNLRTASDLDIVTPQTLEQRWSRAPAGISVHQPEDAPYPVGPDQLCGFPHNHYYYKGFKFVSLENIAQMKSARREDKDLIDLSLLAAGLSVTPLVSGIDLRRAKRRTVMRQRRLRFVRAASRVPFARRLYRSFKPSTR